MRKPSIVVQFLGNPNPICDGQLLPGPFIGRHEVVLTMTTPQANVMQARKGRGPIFLQRTVAGGWQTTYVAKNTNAIVDYTA